MSRKRIANILKVKRNNKQINIKYMKKETSGFSILSWSELLNSSGRFAPLAAGASEKVFLFGNNIFVLAYFKNNNIYYLFRTLKKIITIFSLISMLIWHVHRKSCLAIDYDWFYRSNIYRPYISPQEYIVPWLSLGHSFLPKAPWKEKYCQQQQSRWENINVSMSPGSHPGSIFRGHFNHAPAISDSGLGRSAQRQKLTIRTV